MKVFVNPDKKQWPELLKRPQQAIDLLDERVRAILTAVKKEGDEALKHYNRELDGWTGNELAVAEYLFDEAAAQISHELKAAIQMAKTNIEKFHLSQKEYSKIIETSPGIRCWRKSVAIERVGLYIPGGTAPLFSTLLMLGIPAKIAGCREIVVCTPAKNNFVHPALLYTAALLGISKVYMVGGAQAIAAMAFGTDTIHPVYKIFGPGNSYVTRAKQIVNAEGIAIDMPAGPSEVAVYADESADADFVAADLLSQAEHGMDSQAMLVSKSKDLVAKVMERMQLQMENLPRQNALQSSINNSKAFVLENEFDCFDLLNAYAPEHLIIASGQANKLSEMVVNAGSVFLGHFSPESAGDYISGTNHTLPTNGFAKSYSGVSLDSFVRKITFQQLTSYGLKGVEKEIGVMADAEGLPAHRNAVDIRMRKWQSLPEKDIEVRDYHIESLVRKNILQLKPYSSARSEYKGTANIFLDANENAYGSPLDENYNRYPDPMQVELKKLLAKNKKVHPQNICIGNGSDEIIDYIIKIFCDPGKDNVIVTPPTFRMYSVAAAVNDIAIRNILPTKDFQPDIDSILDAVDENSKIIFLCSPNNPTGNSINRILIERLLRAFKGIIVIDEAYIDFSDQQSFIADIHQYHNLIVLQTLSKAWGLAGLRIGAAFADRQVIDLLNKVKMPYNISAVTQRLALNALHNENKIKPWIQKVKEQRALLMRKLPAFSFVNHVYPSDANFLLLRVSNADSLYQYLLSEKIVVRNQSSQPLLENCLRITVGTPEENDLLIKALNNYTA